MSKYALFVFLILELLILFGMLEEIPNQLFPVISFLSRFTSTGPKSPGAGGALPYKSDEGAHRTFYGFKFVGWYHLGC